MRRETSAVERKTGKAGDPLPKVHEGVEEEDLQGEHGQSLQVRQEDARVSHEEARDLLQGDFEVALHFPLFRAVMIFLSLAAKEVAESLQRAESGTERSLPKVAPIWHQEDPGY